LANPYSTSKGSEISTEFRKLLAKPFDYPIKFEVSGMNFLYFPPLADNHEKCPWHKLLYSGVRNDSKYVIFDLIFKNGSWFESDGNKVTDLARWLKENKNKIRPKKICLNIKLNEDDSPFTNINEFKTIYEESSGRYLFDLGPLEIGE
jgi:hypothetical protein